MPLHDNVRLVIGHKVHPSAAVTAVAARDEVGDLVVQTISVEVVNDESAAAGSSSRLPHDLPQAPVALMWPPADLSEEYAPLNGDLPIALLREGMGRIVGPSVLSAHREIIAHMEDGG